MIESIKLWSKGDWIEPLEQIRLLPIIEKQSRSFFKREGSIEIRLKFPSWPNETRLLTDRQCGSLRIFTFFLAFEVDGRSEWKSIVKLYTKSWANPFGSVGQFPCPSRSSRFVSFRIENVCYRKCRLSHMNRKKESNRFRYVLVGISSGGHIEHTRIGIRVLSTWCTYRRSKGFHSW